MQFMAPTSKRFGSTRKDNDQGRFLKAIVGIIGKRITYAALTGAEEGLHPAGAGEAA